MSKYKIINLSFFGVALLIASFFPDLNSASAKNELSRERKFLPTIISNQDLWEKDGSGQIPQKILSNQKLPSIITRPNQQPKEVNHLLVMDSNLIARETTNTESRLGLTKLGSFSLFLLFFIPLGIFYPLFLFYRQLLNVEPKKQSYPDYALEPNYQSEFSEPPTTPVLFDFPVKEDASLATVSKLQIAFSPQARCLRQKLEQISSNEDLNKDQDIVDLMCKTVLALVSQQDWTHINYTSVSLPLEKVQREFDLISQTERNKFLSKELSIVNQNQPQQIRENHFLDRDTYRYVVVTLVFCTTHNAPLFSKIHTGEQLIKELGKLGKMKQDALIEFELLWNPQQKDQYITNDQLLMKYSDMVRLL